MNSPIIKAKDLSKKIGITDTSLIPVLARFDKYAVGHKWVYKYNKQFLTELRNFYEKRAKSCTGRLSVIYYRVTYNIDQLLKKM